MNKICINKPFFFLFRRYAKEDKTYYITIFPTTYVQTPMHPTATTIMPKENEIQRLYETGKNTINNILVLQF